MKKRYAKILAEFDTEPNLLKVEHFAAIDFFERTGKNYYKLRPTQQRKILENWKEDHEPTR